MARSFLFSTLILLAGLPVSAQIIGGPGVGYPGGGYPGGGRRNPRGAQQPPSQPNDKPSAPTLTGILRKIDEKDVIIESDEQAISTVAIPGSTKYTNASGGKAGIGDFQPGDHVRISATQDDKGNYKAQTVALVREGTLEEHAAASQATDDPTHPITKPATTSSASKSSDTPTSGDRPQLRRAGSSSGDTSTSSNASSSTSSNNDDSDRPKLHRATSSSNDAANSSSSSSNSSDDGDRPRLRRASSSSDSAASNSSSGATPPAPDSASIDPSSSATIVRRRPAPSAASTPAPQAAATPRDSDDSGPPKLRRAPPPEDSAPVVADARPTLHADDSGGVTRLPPPPTEGPAAGMAGRERIIPSGDEVIDRARAAAFSFSETLPNYVVKQFTTRYATGAARGGKTSWQVLDTVTADVIDENGTEKYKNILVNGKPPKTNLEDSGSWSSGEFSSLLLDVMSPSTEADFHGKRATTIVSRSAFRYDFSVAQANSHWKVESGGQSYMPAYTGSIWIDKESSRVLRIEMSAQGMPRGFPLDTVESAIDYDFVLIGEGKFLLPVSSEVLNCGRGTSECGRNVIEFRNYRKFSSETSITFDDK